MKNYKNNLKKFVDDSVEKENIGKKEREKKYRVKHELLKLIEAVGVTQYITALNWYLNQKQPSLDHAFKIAQFYKVPISKIEQS